MDEAYSRTFLCIDVGPFVRDALAKLNRRLSPFASRLGLVDPSRAHLTLLFLGAIDAATAQRVVEAMDACCARHPPFTLQPGGGGFFGSERHPKVFWAGMPPDPVLLALQADLAAAVTAAGVSLETRPYRPHLTIARVRSALPPGSLTSIISSINNTHFAEIPVDRVLFLNSRLNGPGPRYTTVHQSPLKGH